MGIVLALLLGAPVVGVQSDGAPPCDTKSFAHALGTLRPELQILALEPTTPAPAGAWVVRIEGLGFERALLRVTGGAQPLQRSLPGQDCVRAVQTAASMVDSLLEQLPDAEPLERVAAVAAPSSSSLAVFAGAGTLQGPIAWVPSFTLGARLGFGSLELVGAADVGLQASVPLATLDQGPVGNYQAVPVDLELGIGWGPHFGPGRLSLDGLLGFALTVVNASPDNPADARLFSTQDQVASAFFVAVSAAYTFDLWGNFLFGARVEERLAPQQVSVTVDGQQPGDRVLTRRLAFGGTLFVGWRFF